ncbi:hypothetical protein I6E81_03145 [Salinibacterium sp. NG22]|nr:hypothetical protein [Salinibacterium sp. NG22]
MTKVDAVGAGDSFVAGFVSSLEYSNNIDRAVDCGVAIASAAVVVPSRKSGPCHSCAVAIRPEVDRILGINWEGLPSDENRDCCKSHSNRESGVETLLSPPSLTESLSFVEAKS